MKNLSVILIFCQLLLSTATIAQIKVNTNGYVGINNTNPQYRLDLAGNLRLVNGSYTIIFDTGLYPSGTVNLGRESQRWTDFYTHYGFFTVSPITTSDINYKLNIADVIHIKDKLKLLRPVSYSLNTDKLNLSKDAALKLPLKEMGFIAQELKEVFPELVSESESGTLGIRYTEIIPILVQAFKEQQEEIDLLKKRIEVLENKKVQ